MNYIAPRNMTVASTSGRSQTFKKGEPTWAPPQMHAELIGLGIVPEDDIEEDEDAKKGPVAPVLPEEREKALFTVFEAMVLKGKREEFTGVGTPHLAVLKSTLGWEVSAKERDAAWTKFQQERATT